MELAKSPVVDEYRFIYLLTSAMYLYTGEYIFSMDDIQHRLYKYKKDEKYKDLFEDIMEKSPFDDEPYVDLHIAIQTAFTFGALNKILNCGKTMYVINIRSRSEAEDYIKRFPDYIQEEIKSLGIDLKGNVRNRK